MHLLPVSCSDCGTLGPSDQELRDAGADVAVHMCDDHEWLLLAMTIPTDDAGG